MRAFEISQELRGHRAGRGYLCFCPAHKNENTPALSITDTDDGRVLWYCHAGCSQDAVRDALVARGLLDQRADSSDNIRAIPTPKPHTDDTADRRAIALHLWRKRRPIEATIAETYLREHRGIRCPLPRTLGFLPARDPHAPALIAAFGMAHEVEPGVIAISDDAVRAVHLIKLTSDGRKHPEVKVGDRVLKPKITLGVSLGSPIVLAPLNDLLGLAICEGVEDALSIHEATGLGAWAAGGARRMPALADAVPDYCDCCSIFADANKAGEENSALLAERLHARGIYAEIVPSAGAAS